MKRFLKFILCTIFIAITLNFVACNKEISLGDFSLGSSNEKYIIFDDDKVDKDEVLSYESPYKDVATPYFNDKLTDEEQVLYKAYIYAYEHGYTKIKYYSKNEDLWDSYKKAVQCACAQNPFIDWNQEYTYKYFSNFYEFTSNQLDRKDVNLKIEAYNKAKDLIKTIPSNYSSYDKLSWIYNYIVSNITYVEDYNSYLNGSPSFIYDGLIGGKTQCSGFADTMTMMCNLAGIQCMTMAGELEEGHAWNIVNLDGDFYYCDPTSDSSIRSSLPEGVDNLNLSFLKSDDVFSANGYTSMKDLLIDFPKACNKKYDLYNVDFSLVNLNNENDLIKIAKKLIDKKTYTVVHLQKVNVNDTEECTEAANYILNYISNNMTSSTYKYVTISNLLNEGSNDVVFFVNFEK